MKAEKRYGLFRILAITTTSLLLVFLVYWVWSAWKVQYWQLGENVNSIFSRTISHLQDSLVLGTRVFILNDSVLLDTAQSERLRNRLQFFAERANANLSPGHHSRPHLEVIRIGGEEREGRRPFPTDTSGQINRIFSMIRDSLSTDTIRMALARQLQEAGVPVRFELLRFRREDRASLPQTGSQEKSGQQFFGPVFAGMPPIDRYYLRVYPYHWLVLRWMWPMLLAAVLLQSLTVLSFWALLRTLRRERQFARMKDDFISNMTHELKTPITTASVALEALDDFHALADRDRTVEYLDISRRELGRLGLLVDKVLQYSLIEDRPIKLEKRHLDLGLLVEQVLESLRLRAEQLEADVHLIRPPRPVYFEGDPMHLSNLVFNLIDNALKYGGEPPRIEVSLIPNGQQLRLQVADHGPGIPGAYQEKVFEKFFRVPAGDRHDAKGHGLGLSYVSSIVRLHGGRIQLENAPAGGAVFSIDLPYST